MVLTSNASRVPGRDRNGIRARGKYSSASCHTAKLLHCYHNRYFSFPVKSCTNIIGNRALQPLPVQLPAPPVMSVPILPTVEKNNISSVSHHTPARVMELLLDKKQSLAECRATQC